MRQFYTIEFELVVGIQGLYKERENKKSDLFILVISFFLLHLDSSNWKPVTFVFHYTFDAPMTTLWWSQVEVRKNK